MSGITIPVSFTSSLDVAQSDQLNILLTKIVQFGVTLLYTVVDFTVNFITQNSIVSTLAVLTIIGFAYSTLRRKKARLGV